eukprot:CAMPEP_0194409310 /NCGR_PEP_ID=MMETSP0176-20130528/7160_1 /TAXON_ID=216777 /ORGANISM="Proboscia alata, Strain PI-D3" /LENGTH=809 /DNA_ID=CAMNT_0039209845 /DNA_START=122 /DNA_END=2551 /DNA_ORIENTATION=-
MTSNCDDGLSPSSPRDELPVVSCGNSVNSNTSPLPSRSVSPHLKSWVGRLNLPGDLPEPLEAKTFLCQSNSVWTRTSICILDKHKITRSVIQSSNSIRAIFVPTEGTSNSQVCDPTKASETCKDKGTHCLGIINDGIRSATTSGNKDSNGSEELRSRHNEEPKASPIPSLQETDMSSPESCASPSLDGTPSTSATSNCHANISEVSYRRDASEKFQGGNAKSSNNCGNNKTHKSSTVNDSGGERKRKDVPREASHYRHPANYPPTSHMMNSPGNPGTPQQQQHYIPASSYQYGQPPPQQPHIIYQPTYHPIFVSNSPQQYAHPSQPPYDPNAGHGHPHHYRDPQQPPPYYAHPTAPYSYAPHPGIVAGTPDPHYHHPSPHSVMPAQQPPYSPSQVIYLQVQQPTAPPSPHHGHHNPFYHPQVPPQGAVPPGVPPGNSYMYASQPVHPPPSTPVESGSPHYPPPGAATANPPSHQQNGSDPNMRSIPWWGSPMQSPMCAGYSPASSAAAYSPAQTHFFTNGNSASSPHAANYQFPPPNAAAPAESPPEKRPRTTSSTYSRKDKSLGLLCANFINQYGKIAPPTPPYTECVNPPNDGISIDAAAASLGVERRRIYDIINILESIHVVRRKCKNTYTWRGTDHLPQVFAKLQKEAMKIWPDDARQNGIVDEDEKSVPSPGRNEDSCNEEGEKKKILWRLSQRFIQLFLVGNSVLSLTDASQKILGCPASTRASPTLGKPQEKTKKGANNHVRRLYDIANVMVSLAIIAKDQKGGFRWIYHPPADIQNISKNGGKMSPTSPPDSFQQNINKEG